ncbi:nickel-dependent hydrogenase large subunit [Desulfovibrio litoralis]|uniref:Periplasmic [NiFe] hydrogenase large subunit n=1 Tax=Desulfovibrio litoralis DSM 11393 TaxID=1121455 RepID=A0A1M7SVX9_9BACT|nr:nickel-dependent hydrogenase large subunit [Desulfovibrio litoralis]SHN62717.1 [NiFe] hydrogenase large subunit [Desulfovibrio litoralis DSM 11393]
MATQKIVVDPLTRIEGHLRIEVEVENNKIKNAYSVSTLYRGIETILKGRDPRDAAMFTQRVCGVCTYTHSLASTRSLENATKFDIPTNANYIRNLVLGIQFLHDHLVHFYHLHALDFVDVTAALKADPVKASKLGVSTPEGLKAVQAKLQAFVKGEQLGIFTNAYFIGGHPAYKLTPEQNLLLTSHYLDALRMQVEIARGMALFGGKNPHPQFLIPGGVTCYEGLEPQIIKHYEEIFQKAKKFINDYYLADVLLVASVYGDCATYGGTKNLMAFGEFPINGKIDSETAFKSGIILNQDLSKVHPFDKGKIEEHVRHSWYVGKEPHGPFDSDGGPKFTDLHGEDRYSWCKAPRYDNLVMETGPLATVVSNYAQGNEIIKKLVGAVLKATGLKPEQLFSTLGRTAARCIETVAISEMIQDWIDGYRDNIAKGDKVINFPWTNPGNAKGVGLVNAPRGGLSHWINIEEKKIANMQLIVPTTWNCGPRDAKGLVGPVEEALIGAPVVDAARPVEILRVVHSFDPCIACAVHVIDLENNKTREFKVL